MKSSLGPKGLDKLIIDDTGEFTITNDGNKVLLKKKHDKTSSRRTQKCFFSLEQIK